jgi:hypothetical protein
MLHVWDSNGQEMLMQHGQAEADGTFRFEDIDFHQTFVIAIMSTYQGVSYYSDTVNIQTGDNSLTMQGRVYETTNDLASISIEQLAVFLYMENGQLGITQFYLLSNSGELTVKDAVTLPRDRTGTLKFHLPDEAQNVRFGNDSTGNRYVLMAGGFADTAPIPPGEGTSEIAVGYIQPFTGELSYEYIAPVTVGEINFLVLEDPGLSLEGSDLTPDGEQILQDGSKFLVYTAPSMQAGQKIQFIIRGEATALVQQDIVPLESVAISKSKNSSRLGIGIGVGALGLALTGVGVFLWRRNGYEEEETEEDAVEEIAAEIDPPTPST